MVFLETISVFILSVLTAFISGFGITGFFFPKEYSEFKYAAILPLGYTVFSGLSFTISGTFNLPVPQATVMTLLLLGAASVAAFFYTRKEFMWKETRDAIRTALLLTIPIAVFILWPFFYEGAETYLGTVNTDYHASLIDNVYLTHHSVSDYNFTYDTYSPCGTQHLRHSARFGSSLFAIMLTTLAGFSLRTSQTASVCFFLFCLPLSTYLFARIAFGFSRKEGQVSAFLISISSCVAMSFITFYIGQNSGIGSLPAVMAVVFMTMTKPTVKLGILSAILVDCFFLMYMGMLPYIITPIGIFAIYLVVKRRMSRKQLLLIVTGILATIMLMNIGMIRSILQSISDWEFVINQKSSGSYFTDYQTESFFPYIFGLSSHAFYPGFSGLIKGGILLCSAFILLYTLAAFLLWSKEHPGKDQVAFAWITVLLYLGIWFYFTFIHRYGYAVFKITAWVQFILVLPWAYGIVRQWKYLRKNPAIKISTLPFALVFVVILVLIVGGNVATSLRITAVTSSLGKSAITNPLVVSHEISGNRDYIELDTNLKKYVRPHESIGLAFVDWIQNEWVSFYLQNFRVSYLSHFLFHGDDENIPDIITRKVYDSYGTLVVDQNVFFHDTLDTYYLTWTEDDFPRDIIRQQLPEPLWKNKTFRLFRAVDVPGFLILGRGWYRVEYPARRIEPWQPECLRWVAEGGEVYVLRAKDVHRPYRLSFLGITGFGIPRADRTVELWVNKKKVDSILIDGSARTVSAPFYLHGGIDSLVLKVREKTGTLPRNYALWNSDLPLDPRRLNLIVSDIRLISQAAGNPEHILDHRIARGELFEKNITFNGLETNRWVRDSLSISFTVPEEARTAEVEVFVPDRTEFTFPYSLSIRVGDKEYQSFAKKPGMMNVFIPLPIRRTENVILFHVYPSKTFIPDGYNNLIRSVVQSIRLESVTFHAGGITN
jgi:hypothetical protein